MGRARSMHGDKVNSYGILVWESQKLLGRLGRWWVDNIKTDLRQIGWDDMDWIDLAQDGER
jgi:hypothetical protein